MKRWYWRKTWRPSFRVIETASVYGPFEVQRRYRWLWMEGWQTIDSSSVKRYAVEEMERQKALLEKHPTERVVA